MCIGVQSSCLLIGYFGHMSVQVCVLGSNCVFFFCAGAHASDLNEGNVCICVHSANVCAGAHLPQVSL